MPCYHWPLTLSGPLPVCKQCTLCHKTLQLPPLITFPYLFLRLFLTAVYTHDYGPSAQQSIETPPNHVSKVELAWVASNNQLWWEGSASCLERFQFARRRADQHLMDGPKESQATPNHPLCEETPHGRVEKTGFIENTSLTCCCCPFTDTLLPPKIGQREGSIEKIDNQLLVLLSNIRTPM